MITSHPLTPWPQAYALLLERSPQWWEIAQTHHPDFGLTEETLATAIAHHMALALEQDRPIEPFVDNLLIEDLYLSIACAKGVPQALERFELTYGEHLNALANRHESDNLKAPDLLQILRQKLFIRLDEDHAPKILDFAGQGALRSWLQITAVRAFIDATRSAKSRTRSEDLVEGDYFERVLDEAQDLELDFLKTTYKSAFKEAFAQAVSELEPRQRNILGQSVVASLSIDQLGAIYGVHRATAARWLQDARQALATHTHKAMMQRLEIDSHELNSIMNLIQSRASVSLSRLFAPVDRSQD